MAGANTKMKAGQVLFKEGDPSDGMYLIRQGELNVSLEKNGNQINLANLKTGAMIGEMAFFDKRPRSATVRAVIDSEVTKISNEEFTKLLKQVPKWFVSLMTSLSTRLRETNARVQTLEAEVKGFVSPLRDMVKFLNVLTLLWHKDGAKEGKNWELAKEATVAQMTGILGLSAPTILKYVHVCEEGRLFQVQKNRYNAEVFSIAQRTQIEKISKFLQDFVKAFPETKGVPVDLINMLGLLNQLTQAQGYDVMSIPMDDVIVEAKKQNVDTRGFQAAMSLLKLPLEGCAVVKVSNGMGFKIARKDLPALVDAFRFLHMAYEIKL